MPDGALSSGQQKQIESISDKALHLVEYLAELAKLNSKIVRQCDEYHKVLWIHSIPNEPQCYTRAWWRPDDHDDERWIEINKCPEPQLPRIPEVCLEWVKQVTLRNVETKPELFPSILRHRQEKDPDTGETYTETETVVLADFPQVQNAWDEYLEKKWTPWVPEYKRYLSIQKVYADLFHIYQELQKLGEQYELVFCLGLLTWKTPKNHQIKRHILSMQAAIEFEPHLGRFTVKAPPDGENLRIELSDMLDPKDQPPNLHKVIGTSKEAISADCWERANLDPFLTAIANSLADSGQGQYYPDLLEAEAGSASSTPRVYYAPALILRKRTMRGLIEVLEKIKDRIANGEELCEISTVGSGEDILSSTEKAGSSGDSEVYFPLLANEEQRRIIHTINRQNGVLVQGPPGTGKSHTIANLICHLLATGKRVLVTAKAPRALKVLQEKIPKELQPLCISLVGRGAEERESLEKSVEGILNRLDKRNESRDQHRIEALTGALRQKRQEKAETDNRIIAVRESETYRHTVADGVYIGTAEEIAQKIKADEQEFSWLEDKISPESPLPLSAHDIAILCKGITAFDQEQERELDLFLPEPANNLPQLESVRTLFEEEVAANDLLTQHQDSPPTPAANILEHADVAAIKDLLDSLEKLHTETNRVCVRPMPWIRKAVCEVLSDNDTPWRYLWKNSTDKAKTLSPLAEKVDAYEVVIPNGFDRNEVFAQAKQLLDHFRNGGGSGFLFFKPKIIRQHGKALGSIRVDGLQCTTLDTLNKLVDYLTVEHELKYLWKLWSGIAQAERESFPLQLSEIAELHEALQEILGLYELRQGAKERVEAFPRLPHPHWEDLESLSSLEKTCRAALAKHTSHEVADECQQVDDRLQSFADTPNAHPVVKGLLTAFRERDLERYARCVTRLATLRESAAMLQRKREITGKLAEEAPKLASRIAVDDEVNEWAERLGKLGQAWQWARASSWLHGFLSSDMMSLERNARRLETDLRKILADLASIKAWQFCFTRMSENHRRHLMSWQLEIKKLGKGTGKHAHVHRKNAQKHLSECRGSVPAWVMPLHRVYETVDVGPGVFDVIIVDEASQAGPEALPLLYLGKQIVVVGDDKQISPEGIGVDRVPVQQLMANYLFDFAHSDSFDVNKSLFDHARIRFSNTVALREHFRCMPEIINFSNNLCYHTNPLIPLRQFPPDRLEPLRSVYVTDGYREGKGQRVINRPEAEKLVDTVVACCQDERYLGMTMGVIALQGEQQAYCIEDMLLKRLGAAEIEERRLICGNPYSFQGDERDVIFISMVAAPNERIGSLTQEPDRRRFNVAASRAQEQMWLFHSVTVNDLSEQCFRRKLLEYFQNPESRLILALGENAEDLAHQAIRANRTIEKPPSPFDSWFEVDVALQIAGRGYRVVPQYEFADKRIDLVVQGTKAQLAVECDGDYWHGRDQYAADMERQRKLERCEWQFFRVRGSAYYASPEKALEPLWGELTRMGITSIHEQPEMEEEFFQNEPCDSETVLDDEIDETETEIRQQSLDLVFDPEEKEAAPKTIHEVLQLKPAFLDRIIIKILKSRPNHSCIRNNLPTEILKLWNVKSRGEPRERFAKKVNAQIAVI
jgi:very-short-patch-repair endonuclease